MSSHAFFKYSLSIFYLLHTIWFCFYEEINWFDSISSIVISSMFPLLGITGTSIVLHLCRGGHIRDISVTNYIFRCLFYLGYQENRKEKEWSVTMYRA